MLLSVRAGCAQWCGPRHRFLPWKRLLSFVGVMIFETIPCSPEMEPLKGRLVEMANKFEACMNKVKEAQNQELQDFVARRLYEMAADCIMAHLLIQDATKTPEMFAKSAVVYLNYVEAEVEKHSSFILKFNADELASYRQ